MAGFPLPAGRDFEVAAAAPGPEPGSWAGAPSAALDADGSVVVAYRVRTPDRRGGALVVARSADGKRLQPVARLQKEQFGAESLERPALVLAGGFWRLYVSCATPGSKHWRIDALDARDPAELAAARPRTVFPGDERVGVKDPVVRLGPGGWRAWVCCHPLDVPGEEDRMTTAYASSPDGLHWRWHGTVLAGRPGRWDARGARVTAVLPDGRASYDGRATREENFSERTGVAEPAGASGLLEAAGDEPAFDCRYLDVVPLPQGGRLLYFELPRRDGSHDLCVQRQA